MGLVSRTAYADGNTVTASGQNNNEEAIVKVVNGEIENVNCHPNMRLAGSKLADAPAGITSDKINDLAVNTNKLAAGAVSISKLKGHTFEDVAWAFDTFGTLVLMYITPMWRVVSGNYELALVFTYYSTDDGNTRYAIDYKTLTTALPAATKIVKSTQIVITTGVLFGEPPVTTMSGYIRVTAMDGS